MIFLISVLSAAASAPFNVFVDFLFEDILAAPLAEEFSVNIKAQQNMQQSLQATYRQHNHQHPHQHQHQHQQLTEHTLVRPRGSVRQSIALANTATTPLFSQALPASDQQGNRRSRRRNKRVTVLLSALTVPDASIRQLPPSVIDARTTLEEILQGTFQPRRALSVEDLAAQRQRSVQAVNKMKSRMTVVRMSMLFGKGAVGVKPPPSSRPVPFEDNLDSDPNSDRGSDSDSGLASGSESDDEEKGKGKGQGQSKVSVSPFTAFVRQLAAQYAGLGVEAQREFQQRWG